MSFAGAANQEAAVGFTGLGFGCIFARSLVSPIDAGGGDPLIAGAGTLNGFETDGQVRKEVEPSELFDAVYADFIGADVVTLWVLREGEGGDAQGLGAGRLVDDDLEAALRD